MSSLGKQIFISEAHALSRSLVCHQEREPRLSLIMLAEDTALTAMPLLQSFFGSPPRRCKTFSPVGFLVWIPNIHMKNSVLLSQARYDRLGNGLHPLWAQSRAVATVNLLYETSHRLSKGSQMSWSEETQALLQEVHVSGTQGLLLTAMNVSSLKRRKRRESGGGEEEEERTGADLGLGHHREVSFDPFEDPVSTARVPAGLGLTMWVVTAKGDNTESRALLPPGQDGPQNPWGNEGPQTSDTSWKLKLTLHVVSSSLLGRSDESCAGSGTHSSATRSSPTTCSLRAKTATAAVDVAVGSAVRHALASGSSDSIAQSEEPCFYQLKHFVECAKKLGDTKFCQDFDKVLKTCKEIDLIKMFRKDFQNRFYLCRKYCKPRKVKQNVADVEFHMLAFIAVEISAPLTERREGG
ncbi:hypothetical protein U0070_009714, partial [Myodes glareolus]